MENEEIIIISLGGSVIIPDTPNAKFILEFRNLILNWISKGKKFFIVTGGGKTSRVYQESLKDIIGNKKEVLDWIGIYTTQLNANFLKLSFGDNFLGDIITDLSFLSPFDSNLAIASGWKPGCSTDTDAVLVAEKLNIKKIINISNISFVCDSDPRINPNAQKFEKLSWGEYLKIIDDNWTPGMSVPFDPIASKKAESLGLEVVFMDGSDLSNLDNYILGKGFIGTTIK
jgi:uridylate kinase